MMKLRLKEVTNEDASNMNSYGNLLCRSPLEMIAQHKRKQSQVEQLSQRTKEVEE